MYGTNKDIYLLEWGELPYIEYENSILIDSLKKLNQNIEKSAQETSDILKTKIRIDKDYKSLSEEKDLQSYYLSQTYEMEIETIKSLKRQQRYAMVLIVFSFFESRLGLLTNMVLAAHGMPKLKKKLDENGIRENDLEVKWNYLHRTHNIDLSECVRLFEYINSQKFVRDKIAHNNGMFHQGDENFRYKFHKTNNSDKIALGNEYRIEILNENYINSILVDIEDLLEKLAIAIDKKFRK